jgi:hypothetical protein
MAEHWISKRVLEIWSILAYDASIKVVVRIQYGTKNKNSIWRHSRTHLRLEHTVAAAASRWLPAAGNARHDYLHISTLITPRGYHPLKTISTCPVQLLIIFIYSSESPV